MKKSLQYTSFLIAGMWISFGLQLISNIERWGIQPRSLEGLWGVLLSPLLHGSRSHIVTNSTSLMLLAPFFFLIAKRKETTLAFLWLVSGLLTWLIGRPHSIHIGASGLIFAMIGYLLAVGLFEKSFKSIFVSISAALIYGGALWGVLPTNSHISWEGHLAGLAAGILTAKLATKKYKTGRR